MIQATKLDRQAMRDVRMFCDILQHRTQAHMDLHDIEGVASRDQLVESIVDLAKRTKNKIVTRARIERLVRLGWLEKVPSDGFGPAVKWRA